MGKITIKNCKCIKKAEFDLEEHSINIKYAPNGTGKTTISQALQQKIENGTLEDYMTPLDDSSLEPLVESDYHSIRVFNEDYIEHFIFEKSSSFDNSFEVLINNDELKNLSKEIDLINDGLRRYIQTNKVISDLSNLVNEFDGLFKVKDSKIRRQGGIRELLNGNGAGFEKKNDLNMFADFYNNDFGLVSKWAKWRSSYDGPDIYKINKCPYCTGELDDDQEVIDEKFKIYFKNSSLAEANKLESTLSMFAKEGLINLEEKDKIIQLLGDESKSDELESKLVSMNAETSYIKQELELFNEIINIRIYSKEQIKELEKIIDKLSINEDNFKVYFNTQIVNNLIDEINQVIDIIKAKTGEMKNLLSKQNKIISNIVEGNEKDIREFFKIAGFPYDFNIKLDDNGDFITYLTLNNNQVSDLPNCLSWGERNAFAVVMFMFEACAENPDLIILDDPISSIDCYKKFAVMRRLFKNKNDIKSFHNKTILFLTHDKQVLIDYIYNNSLSGFIQMNINCKYMQNSNGNIEEISICNKDFVNIYDFYKQETESSDLAVKVVNERKLVELQNNNYVEIPLYQGTSCIIHGRSSIAKKDDTPFEPEFEKDINDIIEKTFNKKYSDILSELSIEKLKEKIISSYESDKGGYLITLYFRLLYERDNNILTELDRKIPGIRKFVNETNHIEDDFIFQLNPYKFPEMPKYYIDQIYDYIKKAE